MKKIFAIIMTVIMSSLLFVGCGNSKDTSTNGKSYSDLSIIKDVEIGKEEYGIAFRKGSDMVSKVDSITKELFNDGTMKKIADKYKISTLVSSFKESTDSSVSGDSDLDYIKNKGTLVIGITDFDPMDYKDSDGKWIGFDAEYAEAVCEKLGVKAEFKEIVWDNKEMELSTKSIDCLWNGMTITDAIKNAADVTGAYIMNYQVIVVKDSEKYSSIDSLKGKTIVAEAGSAGESAVKEDNNLSEGYKAVESQSDALLQVKSGAADACVIDYIMAASMLGE